MKSAPSANVTGENEEKFQAHAKPCAHLRSRCILCLLCWCTRHTTNHKPSTTITQSSLPSLQLWSWNSILAQTTWRRGFICTDSCQVDGLFLFSHCLTLLSLSFISVLLVAVHWLFSETTFTPDYSESTLCAGINLGRSVTDSKHKGLWASVL